MIKIITHVYSKRGLHARPSAEIVKTAIRYKSNISIINEKKGIIANAKIILEIMMLVASHNSKLIVCAEGIDEKEASKEIAKIISEFSIDEEE